MDNQAGSPAFAQRKARGLDSFRRSMRRSGKRGNSVIRGILRGVLVAASITILSVAGFAILLNFWDANERVITAINQVVKFVSILAGVACGLGEKPDAVKGALIGFLYMLLGIVCYTLAMGQRPELGAYLADLGMGIASGGLFSMVLSASRER